MGAGCWRIIGFLKETKLHLVAHATRVLCLVARHAPVMSLIKRENCIIEFSPNVIDIESPAACSSCCRQWAGQLSVSIGVTSVEIMKNERPEYA